MFCLSYMRHNLGHQSLKIKDLKKIWLSHCPHWETPNCFFPQTNSAALAFLKESFFWLSLRKLEFILENHLFTADFATLSAKFQIISAKNSLDNSAHYYNPTPLARSCFLGLKIVWTHFLMKNQLSHPKDWWPSVGTTPSLQAPGYSWCRPSLH